MKDFVQRVITIESQMKFTDADGHPLPIVVSRSRNTNGFASIRVSFGKQTMEFNTDTDYEQAASEVASLIAKAVSNPCSIPSYVEKDKGEAA